MPIAPTRLKRLLFGQPLASDRLEHERLDKKTALAVLSSDAISSVAYATEQILLVLAVLGTAALRYVLPISAVIVGLLMLVAVSYRQTIFAYPGGGGSYTVAKDNLGVRAGLVAAAALLTDYILTVAVSISGGIAAITSAYPGVAAHTVLLCSLAILVLMLVNLRGVRESGAAFSLPTYVFIALMVLMIGVGLAQAWMGHGLAPAAGPVRIDPASARHGVSMPVGFALTFLLLRGFAEGCVAMTGTEAISNGVSAFRAPGARNAAITLGWMAAILATFFIGTSVLARHFAVMPTANETVLSQLNRHIFGTGTLYYALQYATFAVLVLAANTAFADFPRLAGILANDRYMPRQFAARGDRLAFSNGIVVLALVAMALVWLFRGDTSALIPLYAIGVFVCFTLSQAGMVRHWIATREAGRRLPGWSRKALLNGLGAVATGVVAVIQVATKFTHGAWVVVLIIPAIIWLLTRIHRHYETFAREVAFTGQAPLMFLHHTVLVPVSGITKASAAAFVYATAISEDVRAVYVEVDPASTARMREQWDAWDIGVELVVLPSPFRSVLQPLVAFVDALQRAGATDLITVVVPEVVPHRWWEHLLHNKTALFIRTAFLFRASVVVTSVPFLLGRAGRLRDLFERDERLDAAPWRRVGTAAALTFTVLASVAAVAGCSNGAARHAGDSGPARRLVGAWDARFRRTVVAPGGAGDVGVPDVRGAVALLPNHRLEGIPGLGTPTNVGSFDVDFSALGFDVRDPARAPTVAARAIGRDSVWLVLGAGATRPTVTMWGAWIGDSLVGRWVVDVGRSTGGGGTFVLVRHPDDGMRGRAP